MLENLFRSLTNATQKPLDSSARNPLIYIGVTGAPSGLRPALGGVGRRENVQTESKPCQLLAEMALSAVRKNPQEPAQTRGSRQKKANPEGLVFPLLAGGLGVWCVAGGVWCVADGVLCVAFYFFR